MNWRKSTYRFLLACALLLLGACKKEEAQVAQEPELTKYEIISGDYKVYDTMGIYLYDMKLYYKEGPVIGGFQRDSIYFTNFDGEFNFRNYQGNPSSDMNVQFGNQDTLYDSNGKRWKLLGTPFYPNKNTLINDTIVLDFWKTNINYWLQDAVPFYECYCKQIAVKQY